MNNKAKESSFDNLYSLGDAAKEWHIDESSLRKSIAGNRFVVDEDVKKFGKQWVIRKEAMEREYGFLEGHGNRTKYAASKLRQIYYYESECVYKYSKKYKLSIEDATKNFTKMNIWQYIYDCYDYLHLGDTEDVVKDISGRINRKLVYVG